MFRTALRKKIKDQTKPVPEGHYANGNEYLIELRNIVKTYETAAGNFVALAGIDLQVGTGEFVAVIGKSGSGKSTLINMLTGIDHPSSGEVLIGDTAVHTLNEGQIAQWRGKNIGIVFQFFQLLPTLTVIENVMLPMDFCNVYDRKERKDKAMHLLELVDIPEHAYKLPSAVSGGQQQRAAIARALANDPPIICADEPTGNLDSKTANQIFDLFESLVDQGKTLLMVTHDDDQATRVSRTVVLADGEIANEYIVRALPTLSQDMMIKATKMSETQRFAAGEQIIIQDDEPDKFYVVMKGEVHIFMRQPEGHEIYVEALGPGQYFGEMALIKGGKRTASVRASRKTDVEVATFNRKDFESLVGESGLVRREIDKVISERLEAQVKAIENGGR